MVHSQEVLNAKASVERITFVVPVYRELANGNVRRLLDTLAAQTLDARRLAVVLVVNNSMAIAEDASSPIRAENQATLIELEAAKSRYAFELRYLDLSTRGCERNMGRIRNEGVSEAKRETSTPEERHVIVHMDCDTRFDADFAERLVKEYEAGLDVLFFRRVYELRGVPSVEMVDTHEAYALKRAARDLAICLSDYREGFATYQISSRLSALNSIGGFQPLVEGEDTQLTRDLLRFPHRLSPDLVVRTEDRSRPDGFTGARRELVAKKMRWLPARIVLGELAGKLPSMIREGRFTYLEARALFTRQLEDLFRISPEPFDKSLDEMLLNVTPVDFPATVEATMDDGSVATIDTFAGLFRNTIFVTHASPGDCVYAAFKAKLSGAELESLESGRKRLVETEATSSSSLADQVCSLRALVETIARARTSSAEFPRLTSYLAELAARF